MLNPTLQNQVISIPAVTCSSTHLEENLWDPGDFEWSGSDFFIPSFETGAGITRTLGPAINNWNADNNRPTDMLITLELDNIVGVSFPVNMTIVVKDTDGVTLGTSVLAIVAGGATVEEVALSWAGSAGTAGLDILTFTPDVFTRGPRISCLQFVGGLRAPISTNITILEDTVDLNLLEHYTNLLLPTIVAGDNIGFTLRTPAIFSASSHLVPGIRTGVFPDNTNVTVGCAFPVVYGGGAPGVGPTGAARGGTAFLVEYPITFAYTFSEFYGGGGGGAGTDSWTGEGAGSSQFYQAGGGGGAGSIAGVGHVPVGNDFNLAGVSGTLTLGGRGGDPFSDPNQPQTPTTVRGGAGGGLGQAGGDGSDVAEPGSTDNLGGPGGWAIDGWSLVTVVGTPGTVLVGGTNG
jgi:hypothetical protein